MIDIDRNVLNKLVGTRIDAAYAPEYLIDLSLDYFIVVELLL